MKVVALVQARMCSTRLPNKVMMPINGVPMIELLLSRLSKSKLIDEIVLATSVDRKNGPLVAHVHNLGYACEQGSEDDVLDRYVSAAEKHRADVVVRITGDCPLVDPKLVDACIGTFFDSNAEYCSNTNPPTYPDGLDIEVTTLEVLQKANRESSRQFDHEHVTPYLRESGKFRLSSFSNHEDLSGLRWTVDEPEDFSVIEKVFDHFYPRIDFGWKEVLELESSQPEIFAMNRSIGRNEGMAMGTGQKLWKRASASSLAGICCFPSVLKCSFLNSGLLTSVRPRVVRYGT